MAYPVHFLSSVTFTNGECAIFIDNAAGQSFSTLKLQIQSAIGFHSQTHPSKTVGLN